MEGCKLGIGTKLEVQRLPIQERGLPRRPSFSCYISHMFQPNSGIHMLSQTKTWLWPQWYENNIYTIRWWFQFDFNEQKIPPKSDFPNTRVLSVNGVHFKAHQVSEYIHSVVAPRRISNSPLEIPSFSRWKTIHTNFLDPEFALAEKQLKPSTLSEAKSHLNSKILTSHPFDPNINSMFIPVTCYLPYGFCWRFILFKKPTWTLLMF